MAILTLPRIEQRLREHRPVVLDTGGFSRQAAVAAILRERDGVTEALFIKRAQRPGDLWSGHMAFPGGHWEPGDADLAATAMRETREEIGLDAVRVHVIGFLPDHLVGTGFRVTPVVGFVDPGFSLRLDDREVRETFEVPLAHVFDVHNQRVEVRRIGDEDVEFYDIPYGERHIWGATAGMLMTLRDFVMRGGQ